MAPQKPTVARKAKQPARKAPKAKPTKVNKTQKTKRDGMHWTPWNTAKVESVLSHKFTSSGRALLRLKTQERSKPVRISEFNLGSGRGNREELILDYWKKKALAANPDEPEADDRDYRTEVTGRREYHLQDIVGHDRPKNGRWKGKLMLEVIYQGYSRDEIDLKTLEAAFSMRPKLVARYFEKNGIALSRQYSQQLANDSDTSDDDDQSDDEDEDDGDSQDVEGDKAGATKDIVEVPDSQAQAN